MGKNESVVYKCSQCGNQTPKWMGKCSQCGTFGSVVESATVGGGALAGVKSKTSRKGSVSPARKIADVQSSTFVRTPTGVSEFDRVLGGGFVPGQVVLIAGEPGVGKALALDTKVATPTGWTVLSDVRVGDFVLGPTGVPVEVVAVSEVFTNRNCYKVHVSNGDCIVADENHQWMCSYEGTVESSRSTFSHSNMANATVGTVGAGGVAVKEISPLLTTYDIGEGCATCRGFNCRCDVHSSNVVKFVGIFTTGELYRDYRSLSGLPTFHLPKFNLSGLNGYNRVYSVSGGLFADEVVVADLGGETVEGVGLDVVCWWHANRVGSVSDGSICGCEVAPHAAERAYGHERFMFVEELIKQKAELGEIRDGESSTSGESFLFLTFHNQANAHLCANIFKSLGYSTTVSLRQGPTSAHPSHAAVSDDAHSGGNVNSFGGVELRVGKNLKNPHVVFVEKVPSVPVLCIQVASDDGLFLVGENYTVTHNSTLLLSAAHSFSETNADSVGSGARTVLYVSGEESVEQISLRAKRTGVVGDNIYLADETDVEGILTHISDLAPELIIVDSVQTIASPHVEGRVGGMAQVQEVSNILTRVAKGSQTPMVIVGQINKSNDLAGPKTLEHLVDTVLMFEGDPNSGLRLLRSVKNRFGAADELACFEQTNEGIQEVLDPSGLFLTERDQPAVGVVAAVTMEGRRALAVEVQALSSFTNAPNPRRGVSGLDYNRVAMLIAVVEKYGRVRFYDKDTFIATVGGVKISEPGVDLAVCCALMSTITDSPFPSDATLIGEVTLSGDVRRVRNFKQRALEAKRLGYKKVFLPTKEEKVEGLINIPINHVGELRALFNG